MNELIKAMIEFCKTGNINILPNYSQKYHMDTFRAAMFDVLAWLCMGYETELWRNRKKYHLDVKFFPLGYSLAGNKRQRPLYLDLTDPCFILLKTIVENEPQFSQYFRIAYNSLNFKRTIAKKERIEAMKFVYNNYYIHTCPVLD